MNGLQYTRFTIFHVLWVAALGAGAVIGIKAGGAYFGTGGAFAGGLLGLASGHLVGCLPVWMADKLFFRHIMQSSKEELRAMGAADNWNFSHTMALLRLAALGEEVRQEIPRIVNMLESDSQLIRSYGWDALRMVFGQESRVIEDYSPGGSTEECRRKAAILKQALADGSPPAGTTTPGTSPSSAPACGE
ncbi:MAG: hypothetical protein EHM61_05370 [Acidobacteria bacterium]|nr:MAG: hypothetical protein EHM61_05370 [Acidobacteriota bacterium]